MRMHLTTDDIDLHALIASTEDESSGALAIFVGTVRNKNDGRPVRAMTYEAHESLAEKTLATIEEESITKFDARSCVIVHRVGFLNLGDASVAIVVRSPHRDAAFSALRFAIEEIKKRAPIWKLEHYADGESAHLEGVSLVGEAGAKS